MASNKLPPSPVGVLPGSSYWNDWYEKVRTLVNGIQTLSHNNLTGIQGGASGDYQHLTTAQVASLTSGLSTVVTTAKLTAGGTNGSMTFVNGKLTAVVPAT